MTTLTSFQAIESEINALKIGATENQMDVLNKLHNQFHKASNAEWTQQELESLVFDDDVLDDDEFEEETTAWDEIRQIQHSIIAFFAI